MDTWLQDRRVQTATMEGTGVYWEQPYHALEAVGSRAHLVHAAHVRQMKGRETDVADGLWLVRICQFGLAHDSFVRSPEFSVLRQRCRMCRKLVGDLTRPKQRIHTVIDRDGVRPGGVLTDISNGLAISHTSGTNSMGTDWRDNDPEVETVAEIYQGARQNYEHKNAPRGIGDGEEEDAPGGFQEPGMLWHAWKKGYRIGVIASSDHYSTHISYAMVYTPDMSREAIHAGIRSRRTYGATDNIVLEFRMGEAFMGEEMEASGPQRILVRARGTDRISVIHLIRDGNYIYEVEPDRQETEFEFLDMEAPPGDHWYYVRVEQRDGELAWSSTIWVTQRP